MNDFNNHETLDHYKGNIWISKILKTENRGNICIYDKQNEDFRVLSYISPDMLENKSLDNVIHEVLSARGTLWMLD